LIPPIADLLTANLSTENVSLPAHFGLAEGVGALDPAFLASLRDDPAAFGALPSEERCERYRAAGAVIGDGVVLGERTVIAAPQIVLDDGVVFGDDCTVGCEEAFAVGPLTHFGPRLTVACRRAYFGANGHAGGGITIGGGGSRDPWATFAAGDLLFLGDDVFINPCRPVLIGREVFLTMRATLVTHNVGHSVLEGFENRFAGIVLEDRAQVGIGTVVYAGCRIGREAVVASNSYVVTNVPAGKLAIGVPAKVVGSAAHPPTPERQSATLGRMLDELSELLELRGEDVSPAAVSPGRGFELRRDGTTSLVLAVDRVPAGYEPPAADGERVILTLGLDGDPPAGCAVLDLVGRRVHGEGAVVLDSVREFCRKRGIRLEPGPWRYRGGLV
jgi:acetyltransferase-like isoleucine patch superfamily enzyme